MAEAQKTAVVTGANRGMGLATCHALAERGYRVVLTSRNPAKGEAAARELAARGLDVAYHLLDVADLDSIAHAAQSIEAQFGRVDVLVNNAALYLDEDLSFLEVPFAMLRSTFETNFFGPWLLCQAIVPGMVQRHYGRIVNVSSGAGQLSGMSDYAPSYSASKAALNALTRLLGDAVRGSNVLVNAVDPGWVRTDMGGPRAPRSIEQGVDSIVWLATLPNDGSSCGFFHDREPVDW